MRKLDKKIRLVFLGLIFVLQFSVYFIPTVSQAQVIPDAIDTTKKASDELPVYNSGVDESIKQYLCTPEGKGTDLVDCVGKLYRFGITIGVIALIFFLVVAGYIYIVSGESGKTKAKQMLYSAFTGMAIILGSYTLLSFINPALVQVRTIQPPIFDTVDMPSCEDIGFSTRCKITTGPSAGQVFNAPITASGCANKESGGCTKANISVCPEMAADMETALKICNLESLGGKSIPSGIDKCVEQTTKKEVSFSWGIWQINITDSADGIPACDGALKAIGSVSLPDGCKGGACGRKCTFGPKGEAGFKACTDAVMNPATNFKQACKKFNEKRSSGGTVPGKRGWQPWPCSYKKCVKGATSC